MPSSKLRDDLPNHLRAGILSKLADAVIWGVGHVRRSGGWLRSSPMADFHAPDPLIVDAVVVEEVRSEPQRSGRQPKALPGNPSRTTAEAYLRAEQVRERLRLKQQRQQPTSERRPF